MQLPSMCLSPLRKCHRGKMLPSRIESVSKTLASDFVSWSSVKTGSGASGKSPSILLKKGSGKLFTSMTEAYFTRFKYASVIDRNCLPVDFSLIIARDVLVLSDYASG